MWFCAQGYVAYVRSLPINDTPEIFGLHDNANITFAQNETLEMLGGLLQLQPKTASGSGKSREEVSRVWRIACVQACVGDCMSALICLTRFRRFFSLRKVFWTMLKRRKKKKYNDNAFLFSSGVGEAEYTLTLKRMLKC